MNDNRDEPIDIAADIAGDVERLKHRSGSNQISAIEEAAWNVKGAMSPYNMTMRQKLEVRLKEINQQKKEIEDALTLLNKNPEFEQLQDTLNRVGRFL